MPPLRRWPFLRSDHPIEKYGKYCSTFRSGVNFGESVSIANPMIWKFQNVKKCAEYFPMEAGSSLEFDNVRVTCKKQDYVKNYMLFIAAPNDSSCHVLFSVLISNWNQSSSTNDALGCGRQWISCPVVYTLPLVRLARSRSSRSWSYTCGTLI